MRFIQNNYLRRSLNLTIRREFYLRIKNVFESIIQLINLRRKVEIITKNIALHKIKISFNSKNKLKEIHKTFKRIDKQKNSNQTHAITINN